MSVGPTINLVGQRFGRAVVTGYISRQYWSLLCDCSRIFRSRSTNIRESGHEFSCSDCRRHGPRKMSHAVHPSRDASERPHVPTKLCPECCGLSWRIVIRCRSCKLEYAPEPRETVAEYLARRNTQPTRELA